MPTILTLGSFGSSFQVAAWRISLMSTYPDAVELTSAWKVPFEKTVQKSKKSFWEKELFEEMLLVWNLAFLTKMLESTQHLCKLKAKGGTYFMLTKIKLNVCWIYTLHIYKSFRLDLFKILAFFPYSEQKFQYINLSSCQYGQSLYFIFILNLFQHTSPENSNLWKSHNFNMDKWLNWPVMKLNHWPKFKTFCPWTFGAKENIMLYTYSFENLFYSENPTE